MPGVRCPICETDSGGGYAVGDAALYVCPGCGGYRLAGTASTLLETGRLPKPTPEQFRDLVKRKRGTSTDYPVITSGDLGG